MPNPIQRIRSLMERQRIDGVFIGKRNNFSWLTRGKENYIVNGIDTGVAFLYITADRQYVVASKIEMARILDEEVGALGFEPIEYAWYESILNSRLADLTQGKRIGSDSAELLPVDGIVDIRAALSDERSVLDDEQIAQYREVAIGGTEAIEHVARTIEPGWTEHDIRAEIAKEAHRRSLNPSVILVATDERIFKYRHPIAKDKKLERYALLIICTEKYGLVSSSTRFVHFGQLPVELAEKSAKVAYIDAGLIAGTVPGKSYKQFFAELQDLYAQTGYPDEWKLHHQGGPAGFDTREFIATPTTEGVIKLGQAFAWNPSITGCKSEDTFVLTAQGQEIISQTKDWPTIDAIVNGVTWKRPAILVR